MFDLKNNKRYPSFMPILNLHIINFIKKNLINGSKKNLQKYKKMNNDPSKGINVYLVDKNQSINQFFND